MNKILRTLFTLAFGMLLLPSAYAQQDVENPTILYGQQRRLPIGGIKVEGVENYEDYLKSLEMKGEIQGFIPMYMSRIAQLTNKSNQFNLTTKRLNLFVRRK